MKKPHIFSGNAHRKLATDVCDFLGVPLSNALVSAFSDSETRVEIGEHVRGADTYVIQPTCSPANQNLMELFVMIDALRRASAGSITAVIPYFGYARQDRKVKPRTPISAALVAGLLAEAGVNRVVSVDLHAAQIQGFFRIPVDNLYARPALLPYLKEHYSGCVVVSPDAGGVERARAFSKHLGGTLAIVDKRREEANQCEVMHVIGDVDGRDCLIYDDMIDTAGTLVKATDALVKRGARSVSACATHGVLSGPAVARITQSALKEVVTTDTIPTRSYGTCTTISIAPLLAEAIKRIHADESVSDLFT